MAEQPLFLFVGTYASVADAKADDDTVTQRYRDYVIGTYDAAVPSKDAEGNVRIDRTKKPSQHGAAIGAGIGAAATQVAGRCFPPLLLGAIAADAIAAEGAGALGGHLCTGMPHTDLTELGDALQDRETALIVVGESRLEEALRTASLQSTKTVETHVTLDAAAFNEDLAEVLKQATARALRRGVPRAALVLATDSEAAVLEHGGTPAERRSHRRLAVWGAVSGRAPRADGGDGTTPSTIAAGHAPIMGDAWRGARTGWVNVAGTVSPDGARHAGAEHSPTPRSLRR